MSDQDFFFDEDEQSAPAEKKAPAKKASSSSSTEKAAPSAGGGFDSQSVSMSVAALIGVVALLAGVLVGILLPIGGNPVAPAPVAPATQGGGGTQAPQLSPEQLEGGELPPGHPNIGGGQGATGTAPAK